MNRENRRALKKKLRDKGSRTLAADVLESLGNEIDKKIRDGDLVILNVDQIIALIELEGVETWLFWYGDLIQVENIQTEEGE